MIGIVIVGVGGQGTLLASKILGSIALDNNYDVRVSEVHGMSQRGGSVVTYVRMSADEKVYSTIVEQEQADVVLAFEKLEALRALPYVKEDGTMIVNTQELMPMPVIIGAAEYPQDAMERINAGAKNVIALDATGIAQECGTFKAANVVLLGVVAQKLPFSYESWMKAIETNVKEKFIDMNKEAFKRGYEFKG
ncbi:indolepyruvate oxidoreductase subunit beta [Christensenellaceae bacterium OttesenSCG-928-M15]|nr:indolepyruvate oxidoreductase subunit beta [Christensenellaceae bacterium OttesenSCG-928-M15]